MSALDHAAPDPPDTAGPARLCDGADADAGAPIWRNRDFMLLWAAQVLGQTSHNAVHYGVLVLVQTRTQSAAQMSVAVLTVVLPSVIVGLVAGAYVDRRDKRLVLLGTNLIRAALLPLYVVFPDRLLFIYGLNFLFSTISQFFAPAEAAMIPALVKQPRRLQANSLFQVTFTASQLAGFVVVGPLVVAVAGIDTLFLVISGMLVAAALCVGPLPSTRRRLDQQIGGFVELWHEVVDVLRYVRGDAAIAVAVVQWTIGSTLALIVATLAPNFVVHVLHVPAEDSVFVLAPAGVGTVVGSLALGRWGARVDRRRLTAISLLAVGALIGVMALVGPFWAWAGWVASQGAVGPSFWGGWSLVGAVMALMFVAGTGFVGILVPTQTEIQDRADEAVRGRLFAVQLVLGNVASVLPLVVLGELADLVGVSSTLAVVGLGVVGAGLWSLRHATTRAADDERGHPTAA